jgi:hypothetical protein
VIDHQNVLGMLAALPFALPVAADPARLLGSTRLAKAESDVDLLAFKKCRRGIDSLQLRVYRGQVEVERLWVRFGNGDREELIVRDRIAQGGQTRWIDLPGGERCVQAIGVIGDTERSSDQARVEVWGR